MKAIILTEGGQKIGFGHMTRCLALRDALKAHGIHARMVVNGDSLARSCFLGQLDMVFDWLEQKNRTDKLLKGASIVVVDSYLASIDFYKNISRTIPVRVYMDDFVRLSYPSGIVVNGTIDAEKLLYSHRKNMRYLLGAKYALLRKNFWQIPKRNIRIRIGNILVIFGGINRAVFINKMLAYLQPRFPKWRFHIVTAQHSNYLSRNFKKVKYYRGIEAQKIKQIILYCDVAISAGGQTTNELAACGIPIIGICFAANQRLNIQGWQRHGVLKYAGLSNDSSIFKNLERLLCQLTLEHRHRMGNTGQRLVDGAGALRLAAKIFDSCFSFQNVQMRDKEQIFEWSNSPDVRSVSFNTKPIKWIDHCQWFKKKMGDSLCFFFKIMWLDRAIGQVRFDRFGKKACISIALDEKFRGKGLGEPAIRLATQHIFKVVPSIRTIDAYIKRANSASRKIFLKVGFRLVGTKIINSQKAYHFSKGRHENTVA